VRPLIHGRLPSKRQAFQVHDAQSDNGGFSPPPHTTRPARRFIDESKVGLEVGLSSLRNMVWEGLW
jgi:hypothetical protein